jgi:hypothetical protein
MSTTTPKHHVDHLLVLKEELLMKQLVGELFLPTNVPFLP